MQGGAKGGNGYSTGVREGDWEAQEGKKTYRVCMGRGEEKGGDRGGGRGVGGPGGTKNLLLSDRED